VVGGRSQNRGGVGPKGVRMLTQPRNKVNLAVPRGGIRLRLRAA